MTDRLIRLMRIITLIQAKPGILARELSDRCGTSERTIYRDMDALSAMHIPITHQGYGRGYKFIGNFALHPLDWTEEEMHAFAKLSSLMDQIRPDLPHGFESAYEKVMAANHKQKADRMDFEQHDGESISSKNGRKEITVAEQEKSRFLIPIMMATLTKNTMYSHYRIPGQKDLIEACIDPYIIIPWKQHFYLVGRSHNTGGVQTFRLSYFQHVDVLDQHFVALHMNMYRELHPIETQDQTAPVLFKIRLSSVVAAMFKPCDKFKLHSRTLGSEGSFIFELVVTDVIEFLSWLQQYGYEAEIMEPVQYRKMMKESLLQWLNVYE